MTHSAVLANIDIAGGTRATVLAERAAVSKQAMGELIDELQVRGYVKRAPDPRDGRAKLIRLTPKGRKLIDNALEVIASIEDALVGEVGKRDVETARKVLSTVVDVCSSDIDGRK